MFQVFLVFQFFVSRDSCISCVSCVSQVSRVSWVSPISWVSSHFWGWLVFHEVGSCLPCFLCCADWRVGRAHYNGLSNVLVTWQFCPTRRDLRKVHWDCLCSVFFDLHVAWAKRLTLSPTNLSYKKSFPACQPLPLEVDTQLPVQVSDPKWWPDLSTCSNLRCSSRICVRTPAILVYINSAASSTHNSKIVMFADNIVMYRIIQNPTCRFSNCKRQKPRVKAWERGYLDILHASSLSERRAAQKLCTLFNILHGNLLLPSCTIVYHVNSLWQQSPEQKSTVYCYKQLQLFRTVLLPVS